MVFSSDPTYELDRQHSDCPGPIVEGGPNSLLYYADHPAGLCPIAAWWPAATYSNRPWLLIVPGGLFFLVGERATFQLTGSASDLIATHFLTKGWVVFSIGHPTTSLNNDAGNALDEMYPVTMYPDQVFWIIQALKFIRRNYVGNASTRYGTRLLGANNSIDQIYGTAFGNSSGGTALMMASLLPDWHVPQFAPNAWSHEPTSYDSTHRLLAIGTYQAQVSWEGFDVEPLGLADKPTYPLLDIYMNDRLQVFGRVESGRKWSTTPVELKRINPWRMLKRGYPENADVGFYQQWPQAPALSIPEEANLFVNGQSNWDPEHVPTQADRDAGLALRDPHNPCQAKPWRDALLSYGSDPNARIRKSVIRWGTGSPTGTNPGSGFLTQANYATRWYDWLVGTIGYPDPLNE